MNASDVPIQSTLILSDLLKKGQQSQNEQQQSNQIQHICKVENLKDDKTNHYNIPDLPPQYQAIVNRYFLIQTNDFFPSGHHRDKKRKLDTQDFNENISDGSHMLGLSELNELRETENEDGNEEFPSIKQVLKKRYQRERSEAASKGNIVRSNTRPEQPKSTKGSVLGSIFHVLSCQFCFSRCKKNGGNKIGSNIDSLTDRLEEDIEPNIRHNDQSQEGSIEELEITTDSQRETNEMNRLKKIYCKISVNYFELDNPVRLFTIKVVEWPWFDRFIIFLIALNSLFLGIMDYTWVRIYADDPPPIGNWLVEQSEVYFTFFFTAECLFKIISLGLILNKGCYLRDGWNWLDFTVVVTALIQNLPGVQNVSSLRTFRLFRPLRSLSAVPSMKVLVNTLFLSFTQLTNIMILDIFFILTFAMFGQQMWNGIVHFRCRKTQYPVDGDWEVVEDDNRLCGAFHQCREGTYCGSLFETTLLDENGQPKKYELKVENLYRDTFIRELNFGITNFDSIENSFLTIFQCTTLEGWSRVMMMIQDSYSIFTSSVFFIVLVIICSYFLLNLTVAVMLDNFKQLNQESTDRILLKYEQNQLKLQELKKINSILELKNKFTLKQKIKIFFKNVCFKNPGEPKYDQESGQSRYRFILCRLCWKIINVPIFNSIIMLLIISNTIILATDQYPKPELDLIATTNMYFTVSFTAECILKLVGMTYEDFTKDKFNIFDLVIVIASIVELMLSDTSGGVVSALRAFRLLRLIKLARSNHTLKCLLDSIAHTIAAIINFLVLLAILVYVFALLGMKMFAGHFKFDEDGKFDKETGIVPRQNFDTLPWSLITVFQILVLDQWNEVMYMSLQSVGSPSVIYFIWLVLVGNFIMLNLFLAILLGNFEQASCMIRSRDQAKLLREYQGIDIGSDNDDCSSDRHNDEVDGPIAKKPKVDDKPQLEATDDQPGADLLFNQSIKNVEQDKQIQVTEMNDEEQSMELVQDDADKIDIGKDAPSPIENQAFGDLVRLNSDMKEIKTIEEDIKVNEFKIKKVAEGSGSEQAQSQAQIEDDDQAGGIVKSVEQSLVAPGPNQQSKSPVNNINLDIFRKEKLKPLQIQELAQAKPTLNILGQAGSKPVNLLGLGAGLFPKPQAPDAGDTPQQAKAPAKAPINLAALFGGMSKTQKVKIPKEDKESSFNSSLEMQEIIEQQIKEYNLAHGKGKGTDDKRSDKELKVDTNDKFLKLLPQKVHVIGTEEDEDKNIDTQRNLLNKKDNNQYDYGSSQEAELLGKINNIRIPQELQNAIDNVDNDGSEFEDDLEPEPISQRILQHMSESSLFIFHRESCVRKFLIRLTVPQPKKDQQQKDQILSALQNLGQDDEEDSIVADENLEDPDCKGADGAEDDMLSLKDQKNVDIRSNMAHTLHMSFGNDSPEHGDEKKLGRSIRPASGIAIDEEQKGENFKVELDTDSLLQKIQNFIDNGGEARDIRMVIDNERDSIERQITNMLTQGVIEVRQQQRFQKNLATQIEAFEVQHWENSLSKLRFRNKVRVTHKFLKSKVFFLNWTLNELFENIIYLCILISMILLIVANPQLDPEGGFSIGVHQVEEVISFIYLTEAILRIFALGFFTSSIPGQKGYIRSGSNQIDFFVSVICDVTLMLSEKLAQNPLDNDSNIIMGQSFKYQDTLKSFKVLRTLRALRPLRVISKSDGLKLAVGSLYGALPAILNGLIVCGLIVFIYAIIGISYFKGQFQHCDISQDNIVDINTCITKGGTWTKYARNFDNISEAIPVLFEIITTEGWLEVMYYAIDSKGEGIEPGQNENTVYALFFISFIVTGNIFIMNLFVGIVIDKFNRLKEKMSGYLLMTRHQKEWIEKEKQMVRLVIEPLKSPPEEKTKLYCYNLSLDQNFENFISVCIILSTLQMALRYYQMEARYVYYLDLLSYLLTMIYNIEAVIKMVALDLSYFSNSWNRFDFFIVIVADLSIIVDATESETEFIKILKIVKALRIMRIFRLVRVSRNLSVLVDSLIIILPSIANVGSLIMLLFFIFSVIGMNMFANVIHQEEINENMNFQSFGMALIILMRCATGEGWNKIMRELAIAPHTTVTQHQVHGGTREITCEPVLSHAKLMSDGPIECGNQGSYIFFVIFIMVIQTTMLNLFIAVVLEGFSSTNKEHTGVVTSKHYSQFISHWITYDEDATGWIKLEDLIFFLYELNQPLGRKNEFDEDISDFLEKEEDYCKRQSKILDQDKRFAVNVGRNMVVPFKKTMKLLSSISIPVFEDPKRIGQYRCHFKHVIKRMTYLAMQRDIQKFDPSGIQQKHLRSLKRQWEIVYPDLKKYQPMQKYYSGHIWAAIFISSCFKNVINNKRLNEQEFAFNWALKEKQDREDKEEEEKKHQDIEQLKAKKKERKLIKRNRLKTENALKDNLKSMMEGPDAANKRMAEEKDARASKNMHPSPVQGKLSEIKCNTPGHLSHFQLTANIESPMTSKMKNKALADNKCKNDNHDHEVDDEDQIQNKNQQSAENNYPHKHQKTSKDLAKGEIVLATYMNSNVLTECRLQQEYKIDMPQDSYEIVAKQTNGFQQRLKERIIQSQKMQKEDKKITANPDNIDLNRSTWHLNDPGVNYKMQQWIKTRELMEQLKQLQKEHDNQNVINIEDQNREIQTIIEEEEKQQVDTDERGGEVFQVAEDAQQEGQAKVPQQPVDIPNIGLINRLTFGTKIPSVDKKPSEEKVNKE